MKPKPIVVMEHLDIYGTQKLCVFYTIIYTRDKKIENLMKPKSNVVMEHL